MRDIAKHLATTNSFTWALRRKTQPEKQPSKAFLLFWLIIICSFKICVWILWLFPLWTCAFWPLRVVQYHYFWMPELWHTGKTWEIIPRNLILLSCVQIDACKWDFSEKRYARGNKNRKANERGLTVTELEEQEKYRNRNGNKGGLLTCWAGIHHHPQLEKKKTKC